MAKYKQRGIHKKLVIVGDGACGKTCLLTVFAKGIFPVEYIPTVFESYVAEVHVDGSTVELALWDTVAQEEYDKLRPLSYVHVDVLLICFAVDSPDSLENVQEKWITEIEYHCENIPILLIACKTDLRFDPKTIEQLKVYQKEPVSSNEGQRVAEIIGAVKYMECSAKTGKGVKKVFKEASRASCTNEERTRYTKKCVLL
ncbi:GTP-binding protein Rho1p [[Candida] anglica]|uniref:GTP-binding protein Rho1p n=1 Tax=[Candida] anglica TaxID=148631 RepID=A0ABP0EFP1_9ASCO